MNSIVNYVLSNEKKIFFITGFLAISGIWAFQNLSFDAVPDITNVQVVVNTKTGALDTEKVEMYITKPLEINLSGIPKLRDMRSISKLGLSQVTLIFDDDADIYWARSQVNERINLVKSDFPNNLTPELAPISTGLGEIYMYRPVLSDSKKAELVSEADRLFYLREMQEVYIKPQLKKIHGVAEVDTSGGFKRELHINVMPEQLFKFGIGINDLYENVKSWGETSSGGFLDKNKKTFSIRGIFSENSIEAIKNWVVRYNYDGKPIRLSDVAEVRFDPAPKMGTATNAGDDTVLGTVLMQTGANSRHVAELVDDAIKKLKLPEGVSIETLYTRSYLVDQVIKTVFKNLIEGAVLVSLVLFFFLWNIRASLIVAGTLPLTLLMTFVFMKILGLSGNLMSLGAIDFGLLVDGSVVFVETIMHSLNHNARKNVENEIKSIASNTLPSLMAGVFLLIIVYTPVLFLTGTEQKLFSPMALTVILALLSSMFITVFILPAFIKRFLTLDKLDEPFWFERLRNIYTKTLTLGLRYKNLLLVFAAVTLTASLALLASLGRDFMPSLNEADLVVNVTRPTDISLKESAERQKILEREILKNPSVKNVFSRLGTPESATDPMGVYLADTFIIFDKSSNLAISNKDELTDQIIKTIKNLEPDAETASTQPIEMRFNEMLEGSRADVSLRIFNEDLDVLFDLSEQIEAVITGSVGRASVEKDPLTSLVKSNILTYKLKSLPPTKFGISLTSANEMFEIFSLGKAAGSYFYQGIKIPIVMHLDEKLKNDFKDVANFPIALNGGGVIPFSQLFESEEKMHVTTVARAWGKRYASLALEIRNTDIKTFVTKTDELVRSKINLPKGTSLEWGGQYSNLERAQKRFAILIPILLVVLIFIVYQTLGSTLNTVVLFTVIPFATAGGGLFLFFQNTNLSVSAFIGFITLSGIALLNSIVFINYFQIVLTSGKSVEDSIVESAANRLRPVLMTALVAAIGFLPMVLNTGLGAEVQRPLAIVVIGGILSSTLGTLYILPCLLLTFTRRSKLK